VSLCVFRAASAMMVVTMRACTKHKKTVELLKENQKVQNNVLVISELEKTELFQEMIY
jgi:hypothetical protein